MPNYTLAYKTYGKNAILIEWPKQIDQAILQDVLAFKAKLETHFTTKNIEILTAYNSLLLQGNSISLNTQKTVLKNLYAKVEKIKINSTIWTIPVCYNVKFGCDLEGLAKQKKLTAKTIVNQHASVFYTVYCIGFLPGFLYLGGLPKALHTNRKTTPKLNVEAGSVGIGGKQTGIYPQQSPGGWHIIGKTPIQLFNKDKKLPCFAKVGDKIKFQSISIEEYNEIKQQIHLNAYQLKKQLLHD